MADPEEDLPIYSRYIEKFGNPGLMYWNYDNPKGAKLDDLMEKALKRNRALTVEELLRAQGVSLPPEGDPI